MCTSKRIFRLAFFGMYTYIQIALSIHYYTLRRNLSLYGRGLAGFKEQRRNASAWRNIITEAHS